tara:strand:- start:568 stop:1587 length:1020 start_codon:yes stop_codon:yes gene_type:complete
MTLSGAPIVFAHHSDAALDMESITIREGTITEYSLRNPHTYFTVETNDETGETIEWTIQTGSALNARRRGWDNDTLLLGDFVTFGVHAARDGRPYGLLNWVRNSDGADLPLSSGEAALGPLTVESDATTTTIEGIWFADESRLYNYPGGLDQLMRRDLTLTARGEAAMSAFDENSGENPELSCIGRPTPGPIVYTELYPMQIQFNEAEETIVIRVQYFDSQRIVYMDQRDHPDPSERFAEGYSVGHWEGDTLVVETRNFEDHRSPYQNGIPSGAQKYVVEKYQLLDGGTHMAVEFTLEDPEYVIGSMTHRRDLIYSPHLEMTPFDCDIESTRRFVPLSN